MKNIFKALFLSAFLVVGCGDDDDGSPQTGGGSGGDVVPPSADYTLTFETNFTADTHPTDYPDNASFGPIVVITHAPEVSVFQLGQLASAGLESYVEDGDVGALGSFISTELGEEGDGQFAISSVSAVGPETTTTLSATITPTRTRITVLARISPSPDWFVGVNSFDVVDGEVLVETALINLVPLDAGTDGGTTYLSEDIMESNAISVFQGLPFGEGIFPTLGSLEITREN